MHGKIHLKNSNSIEFVYYRQARIDTFILINKTQTRMLGNIDDKPFMAEFIIDHYFWEINRVGDQPNTCKFGEYFW